MASADTGFRCLRVFFIKLFLLPRCFPQGNQVVVLSLRILSHFKDDGVKPVSNPPDGTVLLRPVRTLIQVIWVREDLLRRFEANSTPGTFPQPLALSLIEMKSH